jgi:hypothetical protein
MSDFIIKNSIPIIENRIKEIIVRIAKEFQLNAEDIQVMLKLVNGNSLEIFAFAKNKRIKRMPFNEIGPGVFGIVEKYIIKIFERDALLYNVSSAIVNYMFQINAVHVLLVCPNIAGKYMGWTELNKILFPDER